MGEGTVESTPDTAPTLHRARKGAETQTVRHHTTTTNMLDMSTTTHANSPRAQSNASKSWRSGNLHHPGWVEGHTGGSVVNTHSAPVPTTVGRLWVAHRPITSLQPKCNNHEPNKLHGTGKSRRILVKPLLFIHYTPFSFSKTNAPEICGRRRPLPPPDLVGAWARATCS